MIEICVLGVFFNFLSFTLDQQPKQLQFEKKIKIPPHHPFAAPAPNTTQPSYWQVGWGGQYFWVDEPLLHLGTFCTKDCFIISRQILISLCVLEPLQELLCLYWLLANGLLPRGVQGQGGGQRRHNTTKLDHQMLWVITCCGC